MMMYHFRLKIKFAMYLRQSVTSLANVVLVVVVYHRQSVTTLLLHMVLPEQVTLTHTQLSPKPKPVQSEYTYKLGHGSRRYAQQ